MSILRALSGVQSNTPSHPSPPLSCTAKGRDRGEGVGVGCDSEEILEYCM